MDMACTRFRDRAQDALDERGDRDGLARDPHLEGCAACRSELEALLAIDAVLASEPAAEAPAGLRGEVIALVHADAARSRRRAWTYGVVAAAAIVAVAILGETFATPLATGVASALEDARLVARVVGARAESLSVEDARLALPATPPLPAAPGGLGPLFLVGAAALGVAEVVWLGRARRAGGVA